MATANHRPIPGLPHRTASFPLSVLALLLLLAPQCVDAQQPSVDGPYGGSYSVKINPAIAALVVAFILGFFFLGFFSVYIRQCGSGGSAGTRPSGAVESGGAALRAARQGLDPEVLASFPTMAYSEAKEHKKGKGTLECAVCLSEFDDDDTLRLLPRCFHAFHIDCIDTWLDTHVTCPVCRANLAEPEAVDSATAACESTPAEGAGPTEEGDIEAGRPPAVEYRRWHSTGHEGEEVDRYTLRLPEHVRREIFMAAGLRRAASVAEARAREEGSVRRGNRGGWSGRWGFLLRTFSVRRWADGTAAEGSSKRVFPSADDPLNLPFGGGGGEKFESAKEKETSGVGGEKSESAKGKETSGGGTEKSESSKSVVEAVSSSSTSAAMERV